MKVFSICNFYLTKKMTQEQTFKATKKTIKYKQVSKYFLCVTINLNVYI